MGPRSSDRGNSDPDPAMGLPLNALQWGRDHLIAEIGNDPYRICD